MFCSRNVTATIHLDELPKFIMAAPMGTDDFSRETTKFYLCNEGVSVAIIGTYDQILDFAADMAQKVMSWPIVTGRHDWFGTPASIENRDEVTGGNGSDDERGSQDRNGSQAGAVER